MKVQEEMREGKIALEKYVITKTLTKPPEDYPDAKNQPHVQVALRLKQNAYSTGCSAGDTVPYIICCQQGTSAGSSTGIAQRARHPDELKRDTGDWMIDIDYYLSQQIHPVVSRLCASIQGTSPARLADCLGLDSSKFQHKTEAVLNDPSSSLLGLADDEERYRGCEPLLLSCPSCSSTFECPSVSSVIFSMSHENLADIPSEKESSSSFWHRMCCPRCSEEGGGKISPVMIANQVKRQAEKFISLYYTSSMMYTEVDLYKQLSYFCHVLDTVRCMKKQEYSARVPYEKDLLRIRPVVDSATLTIQQIRDHCAYGWIQLNDLTVSV